MKLLERFRRSRLGGMSSQQVVSLAVGVFMFAIMFPIAMDEITGANTTLWETPVTTIFTVVLPIVVVIGVAIAYLKTR